MPRAFMAIVLLFVADAGLAQAQPRDLYEPIRQSVQRTRQAIQNGELTKGEGSVPAANWCDHLSAYRDINNGIHVMDTGRFEVSWTELGVDQSQAHTFRAILARAVIQDLRAILAMPQEDRQTHLACDYSTRMLANAADLVNLIGQIAVESNIEIAQGSFLRLELVQRLQDELARLRLQAVGPGKPVTDRLVPGKRDPANATVVVKAVQDAMTGPFKFKLTELGLTIKELKLWRAWAR